MTITTKITINKSQFHSWAFCVKIPNGISFYGSNSLRYTPVILKSQYFIKTTNSEQEINNFLSHVVSINAMIEINKIINLPVSTWT
jgi:hypothetical protein